MAKKRRRSKRDFDEAVARRMEWLDHFRNGADIDDPMMRKLLPNPAVLTYLLGLFEATPEVREMLKERASNRNAVQQPRIEWMD